MLLSSSMKYKTPHYEALFRRHAASGGKYAKKELSWAEYVAFRRRFDGKSGLTALSDFGLVSWWEK